jgi:NADH-quinone oxidoreductase subunit F
VIPGGSSSPVLKAEECDTPMDFDSMAKLKTMAGSGGVMVLNEDTDIVRLALRTIKFYQHESCGWCIPCREGTTWLRKILTRFYDGGGREEDISLVGELAKGMLGRTFCALGDAAAMPTMAFIEKYRDEFEAYLHQTRPAAPVSELVVV